MSDAARPELDGNEIVRRLISQIYGNPPIVSQQNGVIKFGPTSSKPMPRAPKASDARYLWFRKEGAEKKSADLIEKMVDPSEKLLRLNVYGLRINEDGSHDAVSLWGYERGGSAEKSRKYELYDLTRGWPEQNTFGYAYHLHSVFDGGGGTGIISIAQNGTFQTVYGGNHVLSGLFFGEFLSQADGTTFEMTGEYAGL